MAPNVGFANSFEKNRNLKPHNLETVLEQEPFPFER